ncbi:MAG: hypothetical protein EU541_06015 [Promethearchaeota archaeon]|nr:MAG: hypothetical protein EU541_06015 [Candidatus Lokiarchaeota archaeon]
MGLYREEKKFKLGIYSGLIGGLMLILTGIVNLIDLRVLFEINPIFILPSILTLLWGLIALIGVAILHYDNIDGDYLLIYSGALAIFCMFFPYLNIQSETLTYIIRLSYTFAFIDPFVILIGGIIDLLVRKQIIWK